MNLGGIKETNRWKSVVSTLKRDHEQNSAQVTRFVKVEHQEVSYLWDFSRKGRMTVTTELMTKSLSGVNSVVDMKNILFTADEGRTNVVDGL